LLFAFIGVPMLADEYMLWRDFDSLPHLVTRRVGREHFGGLLRTNLFGLRRFHGGGAYARIQLLCRVDGMPLILCLLMGGVLPPWLACFFGIPSLRVKGLYLAVATLAAQFFCDWAFLRIKWFTERLSLRYGLSRPICKCLACPSAHR